MDQPSRPGRTLVEWGLLAYLLEIPFARNLEPWIRDLPLLVLSFGLIFGLLQDRRLLGRPPSFEFKIPALLFLVSFALPIAFSLSPWASLYRSAYLPIGFLAFFAAQYAFIDSSSFRRLSVVLGAVILLVGIDGTVQLVTGESLLGHWPRYANTARVRAGLPHPNDLSLLAVLLPIALVPLSTHAPRWMRVALLAAVPLLIFPVIASQSRNTWIGLLCVFAVLLALGHLRKSLLVAAFFAIVLFFLAWIFGLGNLPERIAQITDVGQEGRIGVWLSGFEMFKQHPWLGIGPNLFSDFYLETLEQTPLPAGYQPERAYIPWVHSLYLEALAERGVVGLLGLVVLVGAALQRVFRSLRRTTFGSERDYAVALAAAWSALLVMGLFDLTFLKDWVLLVVLLLAALSSRLGSLRNGDAGRELQAPASRPKSLPTA